MKKTSRTECTLVNLGKRIRLFVRCIVVKCLYSTVLRYYSLRSPYQVVFVPTEMIRFRINSNINARHLKFNIKKLGFIELIEWERHRTDINSLMDINAFQSRMFDDLDWEDTYYFQSFQEELVKYGHGRGLTRSWEEYKQLFLERWDKLILSIREDGYLTQKELKKDFLCPPKEIEISIDRNGNFILIDGKHRFSIAKLSNITPIPVIINSVDKRVFDTLNLNKNRLTPIDLVSKIISINGFALK